MLLVFNKPYGVLSQFTSDGSPHRSLAEFGMPPRVYALGRLDADSEGLLLLSDEPGLNHRLLDPEHGHPRTYWAQVERIPSREAIARLEKGVPLQGYISRPCRAALLDPSPIVAPRNPPIRFRKNVPDSWIEITLHEGKNRQVRRMTASVGHPTLRLIRVRIGELELLDQPTGTWREATNQDRRKIFGK